MKNSQENGQNQEDRLFIKQSYSYRFNNYKLPNETNCTILK